METDASSFKLRAKFNEGQKRFTLSLILFLLLIFIAPTASAQIGALDPTFSTGAILSDGLISPIRAAAVQSNGFVIVVGDFTSVGGVQRSRIARITTNGSVDLNFTPGSGADAAIRAVSIQSDGKIVIAGDFTTFNGTARNRVARLNSNGTLDTTFNPGTGANGPVHALAVLNNSKILIGGDFTSFSGTNRNRIAQLNSNGSLDTSFNPGTGANDSVYAIAVSNSYFASDIYIGGAFSSFNGQNRSSLAKIDSDGNLDYRFNSGQGFDGPVYVLALIPDNYYSDTVLYAGGAFTSVDGYGRGRLARFTNIDWGGSSSLDLGFTVWCDAPVRAIIAETSSSFGQSNILIAGDFSLVNGLQKNRLARILVNTQSFFSSTVSANVDASFNPSPGANNAVNTVLKTSDGRTLIGGTFDQVSGTNTSTFVRLYGNYGSALPGTPSSPRAASASRTQVILDWTSASNSASHKVERSLNGVDGWSQIAISGSPYVDESLTGGTTYYYRIRGSNYNGDGPYASVVSTTTDSVDWTGPGSYDPSVGTNSGANSSVNAIARQSDGKVIVAGSFSQIAGAARRYIARLNADWTLDSTFDPGTGPNGSIKAVEVQPDGKILIGGDFSTVNGVERKYLARLTATGALDATFDPGVGPSSSVESIRLQQDGKLLVGGWFSTFNGFSQDYIARVNTDGSLDMAYRATADSIVYSIRLQQDGRAIIAGSFSTVNGVSKRGLARINIDGSLDASFNNGSGASSIKDIAIQVDGKIVFCGGFSSFNGTTRRYIARVDGTGTLDSTFDPGVGPNSSLECLAIDAQGKIVIGGYFTTFDGVNRFRIARLNTDGSLDLTFQPGVGMNNAINDLTIQEDSKIVAAGAFTTFGGISRNYIARLIGGVNGQLMITSVSPMQPGTAGVPYNQAFQASGGTPPYSWSIPVGGLPAGLTLSSDGTVSGVPRVTISMSFQLRVTDSVLQTSDRLFTLATTDIPAGLKILEATYGAAGNFVDVKSYVAAKVAGDAVTMSVNNSNLGGDPVFGSVKTLYVKFLDTTGLYQISVQEGGTLVLPNEGSQRLAMAFAQWGISHFSSGELAQDEIAGPLADPDDDGICNLLESAFGGNPVLSDSKDILPLIDVQGSYGRIAFICDSFRSDITYNVEASDDLIDWTQVAKSVSGAKAIPVNGLSSVSDTGIGVRLVTITDNVDLKLQPQRFFRVRISIP